MYELVTGVYRLKNANTDHMMSILPKIFSHPIYNKQEVSKPTAAF